VFNGLPDLLLVSWTQHISLYTLVTRMLLCSVTQYLTIIAKMPVAWPGVLDSAFGGVSLAWNWAFASPAALDCLLADVWGAWESRGANRAGIRGAVVLAAPVAVYCLLVACHALWWLLMPWAYAALATVLTRFLKYFSFVVDLLSKWHMFERLRSRLGAIAAAGRPSFTEFMKQRAIVTLLVTTFFFYPAVACVAMGMFSCMDVCGVRQWLMDMSLTCPTRAVHQSQWQWALGVGVPALLFCAAVPLFVLVWLQHALHTGRLNDDKFTARYGFMYSNYRIHPPKPHGGRLARLLSAARYRVNIVWDVVVHCQTLLLVFIAVYCRIWHEFYQAQLLITALAAYMLGIAVFRPFRLLASQCLQTASVAVLLMTCICVTTFIKPGALDTRQLLGYQQAAGSVAIFVLVINGLFIAVALAMLLACAFPSWTRKKSSTPPAAAATAPQGGRFPTLTQVA
jgi:hypothetical protein